MNCGRIVSCGSTDEIAGLAEDEWPAGFLGVEKAIQGKVVASAEGLFDVRVDGLTIAVSGHAPVGMDVLVAIRPEDVVLFKSGEGLPTTTARNRFDARITALEPQGSTLRATLQAGNVSIASSVSRAGAQDLSIYVQGRLCSLCSRQRQFVGSPPRDEATARGRSRWR